MAPVIREPAYILHIRHGMNDSMLRHSDILVESARRQCVACAERGLPRPAFGVTLFNLSRRCYQSIRLLYL